MARILDKGYSAKARADRIWKADGHPVTRHPSPVTLQETPSIAWKTVVLHLGDAGVRSTEEVLAARPPVTSGGCRHWKINLVPPVSGGPRRRTMNAQIVDLGVCNGWW
jgi:hypothetical protein